MEPIWKLLRSNAATEDWNSDFRAALKSQLSGRQWTQQRCWAAGWDMKHCKCLFCLYPQPIHDPLVPPSVRGKRQQENRSSVAHCKRCLEEAVVALASAWGSGGAAVQQQQEVEQQQHQQRQQQDPVRRLRGK